MGVTDMSALDDANAVVHAYGSTWYEPVTGMPPGLNEATTSSHPCMRAVDEIGDSVGGVPAPRRAGLHDRGAEAP